MAAHDHYNKNGVILSLIVHCLYTKILSCKYYSQKIQLKIITINLHCRYFMQQLKPCKSYKLII